MNTTPAKLLIVKENIDLISGGPPCQSFSLAGKREKNNEKNQLPLSFSKFAGLIQPKIVLLENVKGITSPFTEEGKKYPFNENIQFTTNKALKKYADILEKKRLSVK